MSPTGKAFDGSNWSGIFTAGRVDEDGRPIPPPERRGLSAARPKGMVTARRGPQSEDQPLTASSAALMRADGYDLGIFSTYDPTITHAQFDACISNDIGIGGYGYLEVLKPPIPQIEHALRAMDGYEPEAYLSLDAEDPAAEQLTERQVIDFLWECAKFCEGKRRTEIYTAEYWWKRQTGNTREFADAGFRLWNATADGTGEFRPVDYGGWTEAWMEQWKFDHNLHGVNVDLNTYRADVEPPDPLQPTAGLVYPDSEGAPGYDAYDRGWLTRQAVDDPAVLTYVRRITRHTGDWSK